jgi:hypothetical protein
MRHAEPGKSPLLAGHVKIGTQGAPHLARVHTILDGLHGGPPESRQHIVDEQRRSAHRAELLVDQYVEFGQPHVINLPRSH